MVKFCQMTRMGLPPIFGRCEPIVSCSLMLPVRISQATQDEKRLTKLAIEKYDILFPSMKVWATRTTCRRLFIFWATNSTFQPMIIACVLRQLNITFIIVFCLRRSVLTIIWFIQWLYFTEREIHVLWASVTNLGIY